jgi:diguanylate cyclase (GGDEF)-like protein
MVESRLLSMPRTLGRRPIWYMGSPVMPRRAVFLCGVALILPVIAAVVFPSESAEYRVLVWLVLLVPAFLLAFFRGWKGVATSLAGGMVVLVVAQVALLASGRPMSNWPLLLTVIIAYILIALGIGFLSDSLHEARMRAEELALTDELTGMPNRRHVRLILGREFAAAARGRPLAVVVFDIDAFKAYNDRYGHAAGDDALQVFSAVLARETRAMNISGRWGGEEFVTVLSQADVAGSLVFIERVRSKLREGPPAAGPFTACAGLAPCTPEMRSLEDLIAAADAALYQAKRAGPDSVRIHHALPVFASV